MEKTRLEALNMMRKSLEGLLAVRKDSGEDDDDKFHAWDPSTAHQALPEDAQERLIGFFRAPGEHPDSEYHALAESLGVAPDQAEGFAYGLLASIIGGGKSAGKEIEADPAEVEAGLKVEAEHTDNPVLQRKIVSDHHAENEKYYTWLDWMESLMKEYDSPQEYKEAMRA